MKQTKKKENEDMTFQEKMDYIKGMQDLIDYRNKITNRTSTIALGFTVVSILLLILANLDRIVFFVYYALSYLR